MTLIIEHQDCSSSRGNIYSSQQNKRNSRSVQALKRYLDLTLTGTKKNLAEHNKQGRKGNPLSPYTFDKPDIESSIRNVLNRKHSQVEMVKTPDWVNYINDNFKNHNGEAPMFTEQFLSVHKSEQQLSSRPPNSRPLSGISTKSAPVVINGEMYYRPNKKHNYLQASNRPASAKENRLTRASKLRNKHRSQTMSAIPSDDTKLQLKRIKDQKPKPLHLNKDLLPIPCHVGETPHSFIVGARYNCSHFMDSRSFNRLGLYVPRENPLRTFLKTYKGEDGIVEPESDTDMLGHTSVRVGGSSGQVQYESQYHKKLLQSRLQPGLPQPFVRKVVKEAWLGDHANTEVKKPTQRKTGSVVSSHRTETNFSRSENGKKSTRSTPKSEKRLSSQAKKFNIQGQQVTSPRGPPLTKRKSIEN